VSTAFSVGCVIVDSQGKLIATGYSREFGDDWHAEAVAIEKANRAGIDLTGSTLYSSLEPCSIRKSGKMPCCTRIIDHHIARVVFSLAEPAVFVDCQGAETLAAAGIKVVQLAVLGPEVMAVNAHLMA
jgi:pyrimidine deaminase RibD-like protein